MATIQTSDDITKLMSAIGDGDAVAYDDAVSLLYDELHKLAHIQLAKRDTDNALQTTALVNEAYLKLRNGAYKPVDRSHFLAIAATAMRHNYHRLCEVAPGCKKRRRSGAYRT